MNDTKHKAWELFIRIVVIAVCAAGPALGYQFSRLDAADKESAYDRVAMRERIAVAEERTKQNETNAREIKTLLLRIETKIDEHMQRTGQL